MTETGKTPAYVPPHLRGSVADFKQEPDGNVSFTHYDASLGLGPESARQTIPLRQYQQTFDPQYRRFNFAESMREQYAQRRPRSRGEAINDWIVSALRSGSNWATSDQGKTVATAGLLSALAGAGAGVWLGERTGGDKLSTGALLALLAGGVGAGATALGQRNFAARERAMAKTASAYGSSSVDVIIDAVRSDRSLSPGDQARLLRIVATISSRQRDSLANELRTYAGAAAGAVIAGFLRSKGLLPMLAGGIVGALIGRATGNSPRYNSLGQLSITNYLP
jgi:hypothetical protein